MDIDIKTAADVVLIQANQLASVIQQATVLANQIDNISQQETGVSDRIKALIASIDVQVEGARSQTVLLQQAIDALAGLL